MKSLRSEMITVFLRSHPDELIKSILCNGRKPLKFYIEISHAVKKLQSNNFSNNLERQYFEEEQKAILEKIFKSLHFYMPQWLKAQTEMIYFASQNDSNLLSILEAFKLAIETVYSNYSEFWGLMLGYIKTKDEEIVRCTALQFKHNMSQRQPSADDVYQYIKSLVNFQIDGIENFESKFSPIKVMERKKTFPFLHTFDMELAWQEGNEFTYQDIYELNIEYPARYGIVGGSGTGKSRTSELLMEFYATTHKIICLNDKQGEMNYCKHPSRDINMLAKYGKKGKGMDIEIFSLPPYATEADKSELKRVDKIIQINPYLLKPVDWSALLDLNMVQQIAFSNVLKSMDTTSMNAEEILRRLNMATSVMPSTKKSIASKLENLINQNVFSDHKKHDIEDILLNPKISVFDTSLIYDQALLRGTVSLFLRQIADYAKRYKSPKPYYVVIEELQSLIQEDMANTQFELYLNELVRRLRASNASVGLVQQNVKDVPRWARSNISTWIILRIRDSSQLNYLKESMGYDVSYLIDIVPKLPNDHAIMIDEKNMRGGRILPASCMHKMPLHIYKELSKTWTEKPA